MKDSENYERSATLFEKSYIELESMRFDHSQYISQNPQSQTKEIISPDSRI